MVKRPSSSASGSSSLKGRSRLRTRAYLGLGGGVLVWLALGMPTAPAQLQAISIPTWVVSVLIVTFSVLAAALESVPGPNVKATLIFWRLRHPMPASRAFERANLDGDTRIDRDRLRETMGGKFPRASGEQNAAWYRLYRASAGDAATEVMHLDYLTFRDLAWFSIVLVALSPVSVLVGAPPNRLAAAGVFLALYLLFRAAAAERGRRFVNQVLVNACSSP